MTEAKSTQPQLPPRPWDMPTDDKDVYELIASKAPEERTLTDNLFKKYADVTFQAIANCDEMRRCLKHVEAENESLKDWAKEWHRAVETALTVWGSSPALGAAEAVVEFTRLGAERDKMLDVIREYRKARGRFDHGRDCLGPAECGVIDDDRCPTCIKADGLLSKEGK